MIWFIFEIESSRPLIISDAALRAPPQNSSASSTASSYSSRPSSHAAGAASAAASPAAAAVCPAPLPRPPVSNKHGWPCRSMSTAILRPPHLTQSSARRRVLLLLRRPPHIRPAPLPQLAPSLPPRSTSHPPSRASAAHRRLAALWLGATGVRPGPARLLLLASVLLLNNPVIHAPQGSPFPSPQSITASTVSRNRRPVSPPPRPLV